MQALRRGCALAGLALAATGGLMDQNTHARETDAAHDCADIVQHEHGLLCNSTFVARDRGVEIKAGRALLWFARGTTRVHRMWLTDGVEIEFPARDGSAALGRATRAEYRLDEREIALLGAATLAVNGEELAGERLEYSITLGRVVGR